MAKLDGYVVSVFGAAPLAGERTLVRIEKVGRSAAQASLVHPPPGVVSSPSASAHGTSADANGEGRRRRRGRRGRRKKAEAGLG